MKLTPIQWVSRNKLLTFFILISVGLFLSTTVLAVQKSESKCLNLNDTIKTRDDDEINSSKSTINRMPLKSKDVNYYRLPRNVIPENYKLVLEPNLSKQALDTFRGVVTITIKVLNSTNRIALHSNKLTIPSATLTNSQHENIRIASTDVSNSDNKEMVYFDVDNKLEAGKYYLIITFTGTMSNKLVGFYASTLKNKQTMVASKFQPTYARQAFPCFDEPDFKATYDITLLKPASYIALSNMNEISKTVDPETKLEKVSFATSVPMSTYLACFVVCDFDHKETEINAQGIGNNFILRSFAQKDQTHKIDFAQDIGKRVTEFYIDYYQVPFPLPKLDMIAIPDYVSGATEHWGLVTYRETSFLVDEATASSSNKISVANTIAHELAHMWFGNLVTMKWWDEVWLNEGFASYMQVKALNAIEPSWNMLDQFLIKTLHGVLKIDAKLSSHPIVQTVATPDQITAIFDSISYSKGSSVLRMLEGFIGAENFRQGVSDYLKKHEFGNTVTQDLLACLVPYFKTGNSDLNLTYIMDTWTRQMGYPVLTVTEDSEDNKFIVTQARFLQDPDAKFVDDSPFSYRWFVPITYKTNMAHSSKVKWLPDTAENLKISLTGDDKWLKLNNDQVGYYRVNYSPHMWAKLIEELKSGSTKLSISDRSNLLDDAFALAEAKQLSYDVALNLTQYLSVEEGYVNWETAWDVFSALSKKLFNTVAYNDLQIYVQSLIKTLYLKQSWNPSKIGVIDGLLRSTILNMATSFGLPEAQEKVRNMLSQWLENHGTSKAIEIETDLRNFVYYHGMKHATQEQWDRMWSIYLKEEDVQEQAKLRRALTAPSDTTILMKFLALAWDENNIRGQDYLTVLQYISGNPSGTALVWDDVRTRWRELVERFTLNSRYLGNLIPGITASFNTELKLKELQTFFEDNPEAGAGEAARRRALETVRNNIKWANQHQRVVSQWLHNNK